MNTQVNMCFTYAYSLAAPQLGSSTARHRFFSEVLLSPQAVTMWLVPREWRSSARTLELNLRMYGGFMDKFISIIYSVLLEFFYYARQAKSS